MGRAKGGEGGKEGSVEKEQAGAEWPQLGLC